MYIYSILLIVHSVVCFIVVCSRTCIVPSLHDQAPLVPFHSDEERSIHVKRQPGRDGRVLYASRGTAIKYVLVGVRQSFGKTYMVVIVPSGYHNIFETTAVFTS